jgi:hypothetical protein
VSAQHAIVQTYRCFAKARERVPQESRELSRADSPKAFRDVRLNSADRIPQLRTELEVSED